MNLTAERISLLAERLHLPDLPGELPALADQAASASWSYAEFAERLLTRSAEAADRRAELVDGDIVDQVDGKKIRKGPATGDKERADGKKE